MRSSQYVTRFHAAASHKVRVSIQVMSVSVRHTSEKSAICGRTTKKMMMMTASEMIDWMTRGRHDGLALPDSGTHP